MSLTDETLENLKRAEEQAARLRKKEYNRKYLEANREKLRAARKEAYLRDKE